MTPIPPNSRIYISGHNGFVGSAIMRRLEQEGFTKLPTFGAEDKTDDETALESFVIISH